MITREFGRVDPGEEPLGNRANRNRHAAYWISRPSEKGRQFEYVVTRTHQDSRVEGAASLGSKLHGSRLATVLTAIGTVHASLRRCGQIRNEFLQNLACTVQNPQSQAASDPARKHPNSCESRTRWGHHPAPDRVVRKCGSITATLKVSASVFPPLVLCWSPLPGYFGGGGGPLPQSLRSSLGAPAGGVLHVMSMQGIALRYS